MGTIVVFPRSGYANRLQTIVSTALLAKEVGLDWKVCWLPQDISPVQADLVFSAEFIQERLISPELAKNEYGLVIENVPRYLHASDDRSRVYLAGHDHGEQFFMPELRRMLNEHSPEVMAIVAGGKFTLNGDRELTSEQARHFRELRYLAYQGVHLHPMIEDEVARYRDRHGQYLGLHLRYSDRNTQAPWFWHIGPEVKRLAADKGLTDVFVASDSITARDGWISRLTRSGFQAWGTQPESMDRHESASALGALVDWRLLAQSSAMTYFQESSFAEEACVASGAFETSAALPASTTRGRLVMLREYGRALVTYPLRHGPLAR